MKTLLLALLSLFAQLPAIPIAPGPRVAIEGVVLGPNNQPVAGAEVSAFWSPPPSAYGSNQVPRTTSDRDGRFVLKDLGAGSYRLQVRAGGYAWQEYGAKPGELGGGTGSVVTLAPGESKQGISIRLTGDGIVSGRITSTNGQPLLGMEILAFRKKIDAYGFATLFPEGQGAATNDRGEYRIAGLPPGAYYVRAASPYGGLARIARERAQVDGTAAPAEPSPGEYSAVFFPGVAESAKATLVEVSSRAERRNVDVALPRQQLYRIRGRVVDPASSGPPQRAMLGTIPARAEFVSGIGSSVAPYKPDGSFELTDIAPGTYWVRAQLQGTPLTPEQRQLMSTPGVNTATLPLPPTGEALVTVVDSDIDNVLITVVRDLTLSGSVAVEGRSASPSEMAAIKVELRSLLAGRLSPSTMGTFSMSQDGTFTYKNLPLSEFLLTMSGVAPDLCLKEASLGNLDVLGQIFPLTNQPTAALKIVLAKGSEVRGTVNDAAAKAIANQQIVLVPERMPNRPDLYKTATTDANGRFTIQGVAPGDYKAFAWQTIEAFRYFDAEFMRQFADRGSAVHVTENSTASTNVRLIP